MIAIDKVRAAEICEFHHLACENYVLSRLKLLHKLCGVVIKAETYTSKKTLVKDSNLTWAEIHTLLNPFLRKKYKKKGNSLKTNINRFESLISGKGSDVLSRDISRNQWTAYYEFFGSLIELNDVVLKGRPEKLFTTFIYGDKYAIQRSDSRIKEVLGYVYNYSKFTGDGFKVEGRDRAWNSYWLTSKLNLKVCPYCNRNWIDTVYFDKGNKVTNPQLDHFFYKDKYPILRLSFYNLIPSCETCNSRIKKTADLEYSKYVHPYDRGFSPYSKFKAVPKDVRSSQGLGERYTIKLIHECSPEDLEEHRKNLENFGFFKIKEIYEHHGDIISELFFKQQKYGHRFITSMLFSEAYKNMTLEELYRLIFSNYYDEKDFSKRSFAKLTRDIVDDLKMI